MSIRMAVLSLIVAFLAIYAWRDWFRSLCGLILLMAVMEHPDMPKSIMGIQGLNPWNVLLLSVLLAWAAQRRSQGLIWDMPLHISLLLGLYVILILVGFTRAALHHQMLGVGLRELVSDELLNTLKWLIPGLLLFDGARTRGRLTLATCTILLMYCIVALQVTRAVSPRALIDADMLKRVRLHLDSRMGLHASDVSTMLGGAFWGMLALAGAFRARSAKALLALAALGCLYTQSLTGGRAGFVAWAVVGLTLCALRWRRVLWLAPVVPLLLALAFPAATDRMLMGFGQTAPAGGTTTDFSQVTSGRTEFWPYVLKEVEAAPVIGHGTRGMEACGLATIVANQVGDNVNWPHSAYLEWLLDHGVAGLVPIVIFYVVIVWCSGRLFGRASDPLFRAIGGVALAAVLAQLVAGIGSQCFYPREGNFIMWMTIFLLLRAHVAELRSRTLAAGPAIAPGGGGWGFPARAVRREQL